VAVLLRASSPPRFAHDSEAELARVLDFYQVAWRYEPDVFPISWSPSGAVAESFAPDFYLPELDIYVELTTLRQSLVRKKNRKLRLLRQLYPEVKIKLLYMRDFRALMVKYGRVDFLLEMNGTNGHGNSNGTGAGKPTPETAAAGRGSAPEGAPG
jgi:hypoxanthine phosphoribosyltransferase